MISQPGDGIREGRRTRGLPEDARPGGPGYYWEPGLAHVRGAADTLAPRLVLLLWQFPPA